MLPLCRFLKARRPSLRIVLGGPEASPRAAALLREREELDYVVLGEGEETFAGLLSRLARGEDVDGLAGLAWRRDGRPVREPDRTAIDDLGRLESPFLRGLVPVRDGDCVVIETSRGCPFRCKFCDWQNGRPTRDFPVARVLREIEGVLSRARDVTFYFCDADVFMDLPRAKTLVAGLRRLAQDRRCLFCLQSYLPRLDEEVFGLADSPSFWLGAGVQSTTEAALKAVSRFFDRREVEEAMARKRRRAPRAQVQIQLIYGLPGDSLETFRDAIRWALDQGADQLILARNCVLPGSELGRRPGDFGITAESRPPYRVLATPDFSREDLERLDAWAFRFRLLHSFPGVRRCVERAADAMGCGRLDVWDGLVEGVERAAPELRLAETFAACGAFDSGFLAVSLQWMERLREGGLEPRLFEAVSGCLSDVFRTRGAPYDAAAFEAELMGDPACA